MRIVLYNEAMCVRRKVFAKATSIYDIDISFYLSHGVKVLFADLDNTLDSYRLFHPTERAKKLIASLKEHGIAPIIVSNNKGKRVSTYANELGVTFINSARKPFAGKIKRFMKDNGLTPNEVMLIGDQLITDVGAGNNAGIRTILTDKIVKEDQWTTHFNRLFDRPMRKRMLKKGELIDWRKIDG